MSVHDQIQALLERKEQIDALKSGQFVETHRWLVEAVELLLRVKWSEEHKLGTQIGPRPQRSN